MQRHEGEGLKCMYKFLFHFILPLPTLLRHVVDRETVRFVSYLSWSTKPSIFRCRQTDNVLTDCKIATTVRLR